MDNNSRKFRMAITAVGACFLAFSAFSPVFAQESGGYQGKGMQWKEKQENFMKELNLTAEQQAQIKEQRQAHRTATQELREALKEKRQQLGEELEKQNADQAKIQALATEIKNIQSKMVDERIEGILSLKKILTPEQYQLFQQKTQDLKERMGKRMKQWRDKR